MREWTPRTLPVSILTPAATMTLPRQEQDQFHQFSSWWVQWSFSFFPLPKKRHLFWSPLKTKTHKIGSSSVMDTFGSFPGGGHLLKHSHACCALPASPDRGMLPPCPHTSHGTGGDPYNLTHAPPDITTDTVRMPRLPYCMQHTVFASFSVLCYVPLVLLPQPRA